MVHLIGRAACRSGVMVPATARARAHIGVAPLRTLAGHVASRPVQLPLDAHRTSRAYTAATDVSRPQIRRTVAAAVAAPAQQTLEPDTALDFDDLVSSYTKAIQNSQPVEHSYWVDPSMVRHSTPPHIQLAQPTSRAPSRHAFTQQCTRCSCIAMRQICPTWIAVAVLAPINM
jgi:hypothetical protein